MTRIETKQAHDLLYGLAQLIEKREEGLVVHWRDGSHTLFPSLEAIKQFVLTC